MTIKNLYPPNRPASIYNVINGRPELPANATFSRASAASYYNAQGLLQTAVADTPRFTHDPYTGEYLGLFLEDATENRIGKSEFDPELEASTGIAYQTEDMGPLGTVKTFKMVKTLQSRSFGYCYPISPDSWLVENKQYTFSCYIKTPDNLPPDFNEIYLNVVGSGIAKDVVTERVAINVWRCHATTAWLGGNYYCGVATNQTDYTGPDYRISGYQLENITPTRLGTSYIATSGLAVGSRSKDAFSLVAVNNFDQGFSLMLDSETSTDDFIYKISAGGSEIASLNNDLGTLDWEINGKSAKINGDYPQVGFVKGRVRTISSFTKAGDAVNPNYLYTSGLSFPTVAAPGAGADKLEFGIPQTLKAVYIWNGQLDPTQAVSVIKGDQNIVSNAPIVANKYSFVYNCDPSTDGNTSMDLPYIVPTSTSGGMTIDWGDGSTIGTYSKGVVPAHDYPYAGQYRIQISGNETWSPAGDTTGTLTSGGFDAIRLGDTFGRITRVDQWPPQFRTGASGDGMTGSQAEKLVNLQNNLLEIPPFKYKDLTTLNGAFYNCFNLKANSWDWVPTNLSECTDLSYAFYTVGFYATANDRKTFPQLKTSSKLASVDSCFAGGKWTEFPTNGQPFSNTSGVTNWSYCFNSCDQLESIGYLDTSAATGMMSTFQNCKKLPSIPLMDTTNVVNISKGWYGCDTITTFPQIDTAKVTSFNEAWYHCDALSSFPALDYSEALTVNITWTDCPELLAFPPTKGSTDSAIFPKAVSLYYTFRNCVKMASFPDKLIAPKCSVISHFFYRCKALTSLPDPADWQVGTDVSQIYYEYTFYSCDNVQIPAYNFDKAISCNNCFAGMTSNTTFPAVDFPICTNFSECWAFNTGLTAFPKIDISKGENYQSCWTGNTSMTTFPSGMFDTTGTLIEEAFSGAFYNCALNNSSIENVLSSLVTNGVTNQRVSIHGGTNAPRYTGSSGTTSSWTATAEKAFTDLLAAGWTINYNKYAGQEDTLPAGFRVFHGPDAVHFVEGGGDVESGQPEQESFNDESEAIACVLKLDGDYFPEWDRNKQYAIGDRVKFNGCVYRALQENEFRAFELPGELTLDQEVPTPRNRKARWAEVYDPEPEDLVIE